MRLTVPRPRALLTIAYRVRYVLLVAWGLVWMMPPSRYSLPANNDWIPFEVGARTLVHYHHIAAFQTPALHLFADSPMLQFGPLPVYLVAAFQAFKPYHVAIGFGIAMVIAGVASMAMLEAAARTVAPANLHRRIRAVALSLEVVVVPIWAFEIGFWHHLDDVIALLCVSTVLLLLARKGPWWLIAAALGTAAATKPWAVVFLPLMLAMPRSVWAKSTLVALGSAAAWWLPFVVAAPSTITAMGRYSTVPSPGSVLYLVGVHMDGAGWLRPLQLGLGMAAVGVLAYRGRWCDTLLVGSAVRLLLDPFSYSYYVMGPILGALLADLTRVREQRRPVWTPATLALVWVLPRLAHRTPLPLWHGRIPAVPLPTWSATARLLWAGMVLVGLLAPALSTVRRPVLRPREVPATTG